MQGVQHRISIQKGSFLDNSAYEGFYESLKPKAVLR